MARIAGINVPDNKHAEIALTHIFGIGKTKALKICEELNLEPSTKLGDLDEAKIEEIRQKVSNYVTEGDLRRKITTDIKRLMDLGSYRGIRHRKNLPVNGQHTKNNARTRKGPIRPIRR